MQYPDSAPIVPARDADALSPSLHSRRWHSGLLAAAAAALVATAGWQALDDPRPLDVQLSAALQGANGTLRDWQGQLSRGLLVSLRAVADGRETDVDTALLADSPPAAGRAVTVKVSPTEALRVQPQASSQH